jgi:enterochelin esterase-like enzyme
MRYLLILALVSGCHGGAATTSDPEPDAAPDTAVDGAQICPPGLAGAACVLALYDRGCDALPRLRTELEARAGLGPLWSNGRALVRTQTATAIAGDWNGWSATALPSTRVCDSDLFVAVGAVPTGRHPYKLFDGATWSLDPTNPAYAYDDFAGNPDRRNSVLDTPDSGLGHIIQLPQACSAALGDCRDVTAYLPAGYDLLENAQRTYPVLFMHDGQNIWDDHACCFGHTGWEMNVLLDDEIAAGKVQPIIVIGAASTAARNNEYALDPARVLEFIDFQINELQPAALAHVRHDDQKLAIAGSSLGGLVSMDLALRHPEVYGKVASISGAFWPRMDTHLALRDEVPGFGKQALSIYLDSGGDPADNSDGAGDTLEVRGALVTLGWQLATSPSCTTGPSALCYSIAPGATHDELAWRARAWRFVEFLFPAS